MPRDQNNDSGGLETEGDVLGCIIREIGMGKIREDDLVMSYKASKNIKERNQNGNNQGRMIL